MDWGRMFHAMENGAGLPRRTQRIGPLDIRAGQGRRKDLKIKEKVVLGGGVEPPRLAAHAP